MKPLFAHYRAAAPMTAGPGPILAVDLARLIAMLGMIAEHLH